MTQDDIFYVYEWITPCDVAVAGITIPANSTFYVGKGKDRRAYSHFTDHKVSNWLKKTIVDRILETTGSFPSVRIPHRGKSEIEAFDIETSIILSYGRLVDGTGYLANLTLGGEGTVGYRHTKEIKDKWSEMRKGVPSGRKGVKRPGIGGRKKGTGWSESERIAQMSKRSDMKHPNLGKVWCTDGETELLCLEHEIPKGFFKGKIKLPPKNAGKIWYNNGETEIYCFATNVQDGFVRGRLKKMTNGKKGLLWYTDGIYDRQYPFDGQPEGWTRGRRKRKQ